MEVSAKMGDAAGLVVVEYGDTLGLVKAKLRECFGLGADAVLRLSIDGEPTDGVADGERLGKVGLVDDSVVEVAVGLSKSQASEEIQRRGYSRDPWQQIRADRHEALELFLTAGLFEPDGESLKWAAREGAVKCTGLILDFLVKKVGPGAVVQQCRALLRDPNTTLGMAKLLVSAWDIAWDTDQAGDIPLHVAARRGWGEVVEHLLREPSAAAMCAARNHSKELPLHRSAPPAAAALIAADPAAVHAVDGQLRTPLHHAAASGFLDSVSLLLESGACPVPADAQHQTPLHLAAITGRSGIQLLLIGLGDAEEGEACPYRLPVDVFEKTPLHYAAHSCGLDVARRYVGKAAADVGLKDATGRSAVYYAVKGNPSDEVALELVAAVEDQEHVAAPGKCTMLEAATRHGRHNVVRHLIRNGADPRQVAPGSGQSLLHVAASGGFVSTFAHLLQHVHRGLASVDANADTPLHIACREGHDMLVAFILRHEDLPASILNKRNKRKQTPFSLASEGQHGDGYSRIKKLLVCAGCRVSGGFGDRGKSDLFKVLSAPLGNKDRCADRKEAVLHLLSQGHDVDAQDADGKTGLHAYIEAVSRETPEGGSPGKEDVEFFKWCLGECNVAVRDSAGRTLLQCAAEGGVASLMDALVEHGSCNVRAADNKGRTALHALLARGLVVYPSTADRLRLRGYCVYCGCSCRCPFVADPTKISCFSVLARGDHRRCKSTWSSDEDDDPAPTMFKAKDHDGRTPLHDCLEAMSAALTVEGCEQAFSSILDHSEVNYERAVDVNDQDSEGRTLLHCAAARGCGAGLAISRLLWWGECDLGLQDNNGRTVLHAAARWGIPKSACKLGYHPYYYYRSERDAAAELMRKEWVAALGSLFEGTPVKHLGVQDNEGKTPLHTFLEAMLRAEAIDAEGVYLFRRCVNRIEVDVNLQDKQGRTLLHYAAAGGCGADVFLEALLGTRKCDLNLKDSQQRAALHAAAADAPGNFMPLWERLDAKALRRAAKAKDATGRTALCLYRARGGTAGSADGSDSGDGSSSSAESPLRQPSKKQDPKPRKTSHTKSRRGAQRPGTGRANIRKGKR